MFSPQDWSIKEPYRPLFPAMLVWQKKAKRAVSSRVGTRVSYEEISRALNREFSEEIRLTWWSRFDHVTVQISSELTRRRKLLVGLHSDAMYLGERVTRQHRPGAIPLVPVDPPMYMQHPREMPAEELEMYLQGVYYTEYIIAGAAYDTFLRMRLRSPQVQHREGEFPGGPQDFPIPRARLAYEGLDGSRRRLVIPLPDEPRPRYRVDPNASVSTSFNFLHSSILQMLHLYFLLAF